MRDLSILLFLAGLIALGFRRPFIWTLAYIYCDLVSPQRLSYYLLNSVPLSQIMVALAVTGWLLIDARRGVKVTFHQGLMLAILAWAGWTTLHAAVPDMAWQKWDWAWKVVVFAIFLPMVLLTRLRIEATLMFIVMSVASVTIVGGLKTLAGGGGYGTLNLMVDNNSGLYESSTISCIAIAVIPLILYLGRHQTLVPRGRLFQLFIAGLILASVLIPIGTEARTGLVCMAVLGVLLVLDSRRPVLLGAALAAAALAAMPLLPGSFTDRMSTIKTYEADTSASTRLAVWKWTLDYVSDRPMGGGFGVYVLNRLNIPLVRRDGEDSSREVVTDAARAFHNSYFEVLGEQGWLGLALYLGLHGSLLMKMMALRRRHRRRTTPEGDRWIGDLATALRNCHIVYLAASMFVGLGFLSFMYMILAIEIGFSTWEKRRSARAAPVPPPRFRPVRSG